MIYKYFDDQGPYLAASLTYYAFISIFPLMLLGSSILGIILRGEPDWQEAILDSALAQFPIIGDELGRPEGLQGSFTGVVIGALARSTARMGLGQALQNTQHVAWSVPRNSRPNPFYARLKTLVLLMTAGLSLLAVSVVSTVASTTDLFTEVLGNGIKVLLPLLTVLVVGTFLTFLFRFAATGQHSFVGSAPGGYALAVMWQALQLLGAAYVDRVLVNTTSMTKIFGLVLGLIGFLWIGAVMAVLAIEINVVIARRLWPRALLTPFTDNVELTEADRRAYASYARMQRHKGFEKVSVTWEPREATRPERPPQRPRGRRGRSVDHHAVDVDPTTGTLLEAADLVHPAALPARDEARPSPPAVEDLQTAPAAWSGPASRHRDGYAGARSGRGGRRCRGRTPCSASASAARASRPARGWPAAARSSRSYGAPVPQGQGRAGGLTDGTGSTLGRREGRREHSSLCCGCNGVIM